MSKMSNLSLVLDELIGCGEALIRTANALKESLGKSESQEEVIAPDKKMQRKNQLPQKQIPVRKKNLHQKQQFLLLLLPKKRSVLYLQRNQVPVSNHR